MNPPPEPDLTRTDVEPAPGGLGTKPFRVNMRFVQLYVDTPFTYEHFEYYIRKLPSDDYVLEDTRYVPEFLPPFTDMVPVPPVARRTMEAVRKIESSHYYYDSVSFALIQRVLGDIHTSILQNKWVDGVLGNSWIKFAIDHMIEDSRNFGVYGDSNIRVLRREFQKILDKKVTYELFVLFEMLVSIHISYRHHLLADSEGDSSTDRSIDHLTDPRCLF
jgi:hypothetical protein